MFHYNAFISYNHNPRDIAIAKTLQHQLEHFKVPQELQTSSGLSNIERVFLDTGELEVTGDLNKIIYDVLEDTDYLIVICSPKSRESVWVKREVEFYLKNHSADTILTVISDGEPLDVLPEVLLHDEEGNLREPLSCDYRLPARTARNVELPRLAAAMLGCRYDELVQRQRHYKMRRLTAALSVTGVLLIAIISYLIWSNNQIKASLEASRREQSLSLSIQSEEALNSGDRISALKYALEALPSEGNERPVVPRAVRALSSAMKIYKSNNGAERVAVRRYPSYGKHVLLLKAVDAKEFTLLATLYSNGRCVLWNAKKGQEFMPEYTSALFNDGVKVQNLEFTDDKQIILLTDDTIRIIDIEEASEKKSISLDGTYFKLFEFSTYEGICDDLMIRDNTIYIPVGKGNNSGDIGYSFDTFRKDAEKAAAALARDVDDFEDLFKFVTGKMSGMKFEIERINLDSGKVIAKASVKDRPRKMRLSPDNKYLACSYSDTDEFWDEERKRADDVVVISNADNLKEIGTADETCVTDFSFDQNDRLIICGFDEKVKGIDLATNKRVIFMDDGNQTELMNNADRNLVVKCIDAATCDEIWSNKHKVHTPGTPWLILGSPASMISNAVICTTGNAIIIEDPEGKDITSLYPLDIVRKLVIEEDKLLAILEDGELVTWRQAGKGKMKSTTGFNVINGPVLMYTSAGEDMFTVSTDSERDAAKEFVTQYRNDMIDPEFESYDYGDKSVSPSGETLQFTDIGIWGDSFVEILREPVNNKAAKAKIISRILVRDSKSGKILLDHDVALGTAETHFMYSGIDSKNGKVYFLENLDFKSIVLASVDLSSGDETRTKLIINNQGEDSMYVMFQPAMLYNGYQEYAGEFSVDAGHITYAAIEASYSNEKNDFVFGKVIFDVDTETGRTDVYRYGEPEDDFDDSLYPNVRLCSPKKRVVNLGNSIFSCLDYKGNTIWESEELEYEPAGFTCTDDGTVIALERGYDSALHIYSGSDGKEIAVTDLGLVSLFDHEKMSWMKISEDEQLVVAGDDGYLLDNATWEIRTSINDTYLAFNPEAKQIMIGDPDKFETGHVPYRSLDEMIEEAQSMVE